MEYRSNKVDEEEVKEKLNRWMVEFVEAPNSLLGGWAPCPYARQARINSEIEVLFIDAEDMFEEVNKNLGLLDKAAVLVMCFDHTLIDPETLERAVASYNELLMRHDYVILEDHPNKKEVVNEVSMNFGECGLLLVQKLSKLNHASKQLRKQGYYKNWPQSHLDYVVEWRDK
jgi:hypothetical protein